MSDDLPFAFVLMPFDSSFDDIYKLGIVEPANTAGVHAQRVDDQIYDEGILERICRQIEVADIIVADMTGRNPNVAFEVGYAHAKGKLCLHITQDVADIPFDLKNRRYFVYGESIDRLREQMVKEFKWAKTQIENVNKSHLRVTLASQSGDLERTKHLATAKVDLKIDLHNESDEPSAEIEAIYFHSGNEWTLYQNGRKCPSTKSDLSAGGFMYFLESPVRRISRSGWAQLAFCAERVFASAWKGDVLEDSYPVRGFATLRLVTDRGEFDYPISINTVAQYIPF